MNPTPRQLIIVRHAKSSWPKAATPDHDRPLNARGRKDGAWVGRYLVEAGLHPQLVLCSSATRATQTLDLLGIAVGSEIVIEDSLYGADAGTLMDRLRHIADAVGSVLIIAHNPGVEELTRVLVGDRISWVEKFPTAAIAVVDLAIPTWASLDVGIGDLRELKTPPDLE